MRKTIANIEGLGIIVQSDGDLYTNVKDLKGKLISVRNEACTRIETDGKENIGAIDGTNVSMIVKYLKDELPVLVKQTIFSEELAKLLVKANSQRKYFSTGSEEGYEQARNIADKQEKQGIPPEKRTSIACPSRVVFDMSPTKNSEHFTFIFEDMAKGYYNKNGKPVRFHPINYNIIDGKNSNVLTNPKGTIENYVWFACFNDGQGLIVGNSGIYGTFDAANDPNISARSVKKSRSDL